LKPPRLLRKPARVGTHRRTRRLAEREEPGHVDRCGAPRMPQFHARSLTADSKAFLLLLHAKTDGTERDADGIHLWAL